MRRPDDHLVPSLVRGRRGGTSAGGIDLRADTASCHLMVVPGRPWVRDRGRDHRGGSVSTPCIPCGRTAHVDVVVTDGGRKSEVGDLGQAAVSAAADGDERLGPPPAAHPKCVVTGRRTDTRRSRRTSWSRPGGAAPRFAAATTVLVGTAVPQEDAPLFGLVHRRSTATAHLTCGHDQRSSPGCHRSFRFSSSAPSAWLG